MQNTNLLYIYIYIYAEHKFVVCKRMMNKYMYTFRHLEDLEMVPQPQKVHVPSNTLRTWKWAPTPQLLDIILVTNRV